MVSRPGESVVRCEELGLQEQQCLGIILQMRDLRESDQLVTFFTEEAGRLVLCAPRARRSKRRFAGLLQSFSKHEITFRQGKGSLPLLLRLEAKEFHLPLREDLSAFAAASYAAELLLRLTEEGDANPLLFRFFDTFLGYCEAHSPLSAKAHCRFHLRLLELLGLQPEFSRCLECGSALEGRAGFFDFSQGGALCETCPPAHPHRATPLRGELRSLLQSCQSRHQTDSPPLLWNSAVEVLDMRMAHLLGKPPQSRSFLKQMIGF